MGSSKTSASKASAKIANKVGKEVKPKFGTDIFKKPAIHSTRSPERASKTQRGPKVRIKQFRLGVVSAYVHKAGKPEEEAYCNPSKEYVRDTPDSDKKFFKPWHFVFDRRANANNEQLPQSPTRTHFPFEQFNKFGHQQGDTSPFTRDEIDLLGKGLAADLTAHSNTDEYVYSTTYTFDGDDTDYSQPLLPVSACLRDADVARVALFHFGHLGSMESIIEDESAMEGLFGDDPNGAEVLRRIPLS